MKKVFIDGSAGTTGLRIAERLEARKDIEIIRLEDSVRKEPGARAKALAEADIAFLCLPDDAAREAVALLDEQNTDTVIIDTSTAHRTSEGWAYGFPEIGGRREEIKKSRRIANPGCHASGFIALVAPLTEAGLVGSDTQLSCFSLTGYSGGGKKMIAEYGELGFGNGTPSEEDALKHQLFEAPRAYGISQQHKHLPEMCRVCGLAKPPVFVPVVAPYYAGMEVTVPLTVSDINPEITCTDLKKQVEEIFEKYYSGEKLVRFVKDGSEDGFLSAALRTGMDDMEVTVLGNDERVTLVARFDNLGKGASGAALQNMNIVLGLADETGLCI